MKPDKIKEWLTKKQWEDYIGFMGYACVHKALDTSGIDRIVADLAATRELSEQRRVLMEKEQYQLMGPLPGFWPRCVGCNELGGKPCKPDCLWAQAIGKEE